MSNLKLAGGSAFCSDDYAFTVRPLSDDEGGGFLATIPDLPGCMGDGETEMEAILDVRSAALCWIEGALADGEDIPTPSRRALQAAE